TAARTAGGTRRSGFRVTGRRGAAYSQHHGGSAGRKAPRRRGDGSRWCPPEGRGSVPGGTDGRPTVTCYDEHTMTGEARRVLHAALQRPARDREELVELLEQSLDEGSIEEIEAAWIEEVKRRIAEIDSGEATLVSSESARRMRAEILERARSRRAG